MDKTKPLLLLGKKTKYANTQHGKNKEKITKCKECNYKHSYMPNILYHVQTKPEHKQVKITSYVHINIGKQEELNIHNNNSHIDTGPYHSRNSFKIAKRRTKQKIKEYNQMTKKEQQKVIIISFRLRNLNEMNVDNASITPQ